MKENPKKHFNIKENKHVGDHGGTQALYYKRKQYRTKNEGELGAYIRRANKGANELINRAQVNVMKQ